VKKEQIKLKKQKKTKKQKNTQIGVLVQHQRRHPKQSVLVKTTVHSRQKAVRLSGGAVMWRRYYYYYYYYLLFY